MELEVYDAYKDSCVEWLGEIPIDWEVHRIKDFLNFEIGGTPPTGRDDYFEGENIWISIADLNDVVQDTIKDSKIKISDEAVRNSNVKKVEKGSLLFSFKLSVGKLAFAGCELYTNEAIASFKPNSIVNLNFLKYVLQTGFENNAAENIYGAKLFNKDLINFGLYVMPQKVNVQKTIAIFLDDKIFKIDYLIEKNQKLIELLEEKRTSLINRAVTKGLDPDVPMKDSGIDWIGEIPEHWGMERIKFITSLRKEKGEYSQDDIFLGLENIESNTGKYLITDTVYEELEYDKFYKGDLLFNKLRPYLAKIFLADFDGFCTSELAIIKETKINKKYLFYFFFSDGFLEVVNSSTYGAKMPRASWNFIENLRIPIPTEDEQKEIVSFLDLYLSNLYNLKIKIIKENELLEEYKQSLIYNVVTGKVKVEGE